MPAEALRTEQGKELSPKGDLVAMQTCNVSVAHLHSSNQDNAKQTMLKAGTASGDAAIRVLMYLSPTTHRMQPRAHCASLLCRERVVNPCISVHKRIPSGNIGDAVIAAQLQHGCCCQCTSVKTAMSVYCHWPKQHLIHIWSIQSKGHVAHGLSRLTYQCGKLPVYSHPAKHITQVQNRWLSCSMSTPA